MVTTMDSAGRLVIPKEIRKEAHLEPGTPVDVRWHEGVIEIEPHPLEVQLERKGRLLVAKPVHPVPVLKASEVDRTRREIQSERG